MTCVWLLSSTAPDMSMESPESCKGCDGKRTGCRFYTVDEDEPEPNWYKDGDNRGSHHDFHVDGYDNW